MSDNEMYKLLMQYVWENRNIPSPATNGSGFLKSLEDLVRENPEEIERIVDITLLAAHQVWQVKKDLGLSVMSPPVS